MFVLGTSMFRPLYRHLCDNSFVYIAWVRSLTIRQQEMRIVANIHPALPHGLDKPSVPGGSQRIPTLDPSTNVSEPWYLRLINDVNAYLSPYQLLEVPTHVMGILKLPGFKEAWKGRVTLRLRHRMDLCVTLTLFSYSRWQLRTKNMSSWGDVPVRVTCSTHAFSFINELPFQQ
jgi:hypothetical protein